MKKSICLLVMLLISLSVLSLAQAATRFNIKKTGYIEKPDGSWKFFLKFDQPVAELKFQEIITKIENTEIIGLEFENTVAEEIYHVLPVKSGGIIKTVTAQYKTDPDISRFIIYMDKKINYKVTRQDDFLVIEVGAVEEKAVAPLPAAPAAPAAPPAPAEPKLTIEGYKLWNFSNVSINPVGNLFLAQTYFEGIRPTPSGRLFDWREKLKLRINGQVTEKIGVSYDLMQDPDFPPDQYNITITYDKSRLTFGDFTTDVGGNEFATLTKSMNGAMLTSRDDPYEATLILAKDRSNSKTDSFFGNGSKGPYKLSNTFVVENSETVFINSVRQVRNRDYTINYYDGEISFTNLLSTLDSVEVRYEYSSIIDLFFPLASRKEFTGARLKINWEKALAGPPETAGAQPEAVIKDFFENLAGADSRGPYHLKHKNILEKSPEVLLNGQKLWPDQDYIFDYANGKIIFIFNIPRLSKISVKYRYREIQNHKIIFPADTHFSTGVTYFQENTPAGESVNTLTYSDTFSIATDSQGAIKRTYQLNNYPLVGDSEEVRLDSQLLVRDIDYSPDLVKGQITLSPELPVTIGQSLKVDYKYYKNYPFTYTTSGNNSLSSYYLPFRPAVYASEIVRIKENGADYYKNLRKWDGILSPDLYNVGEIVYTIDYPDGIIDFKQLDDRGNFNPYLVPSTTAIAIDFRYVQEQSASQTSLNNQLVGLDSQLKINNWDFKVNAAQSNSNQPQGVAYQTDEFSGTGEKTYTLTREPLTDSEQVSVNGNLLTNDIDYLISYTAKKITFIKYTPGLLDNISVRYRYQIETTSATQKGRALSFYTKGQLGRLTVDGELKKIDPAFFPVGNATSRGAAGSQDQVLKLNYDFTDDVSAGSSIERYSDQIGGTALDPVFLKTEKNGYQAKIKTFGWGELFLSLNDTLTYDQNPAQTTHDFDTKRTDLKAGFQFGPKDFSSLVEAGKTSSRTDVLDRQNETQATVYLLHGKNFWKIMENAKLTTDLQRSEETTDYFSLLTSQKRTVDAVDLDLFYDPFQTLTTETSILWQKIDPHSSDLKINTNKKIAYQLNYNPADWFNFKFGRADEERANVFENQPNTLTNSFNWASSIKPATQSTLTFSQSQRTATEGLDRKYDSSNFTGGLSYQITEPLELTLGYTHSASDSLYALSYRASFDKIYSANLAYKFTPQITLKTGAERDYFLTEQALTAVAGTGQSTAGLLGADWQVWTDLLASLNFKFEDYHFNSDPVTRTNNFYAGSEIKYAPLKGISAGLTVNQVFIKNKDTGITRPATDLKSNIKIPVFDKSWFVLEFEQTDTNGRLRKSAVEDIDSLKKAMTAGIDFEIPVEGSTTTLIMSAKYRHLSYADRLNAQNNFEANVIMGEAKLQF